MKEVLSSVLATKGHLSNARARSQGLRSVHHRDEVAAACPSRVPRPGLPVGVVSQERLSHRERAAWGKAIKSREICASREVRGYPLDACYVLFIPGVFYPIPFAGTACLRWKEAYELERALLVCDVLTFC